MTSLPLEITVEELFALPQGSCRLIDLRPAEEQRHRALPGALSMTEEALADWTPEDALPSVLVCSRGVISLRAAGKLRERGIAASALSGGFPAWMLHRMAAMDAEAVTRRAEASLEKKFRKTMWSKFTKAINTYDLLQPGDRVAVCISGGKDSMAMAKLFQKLHAHSKFPFDVEFMVMDPGYSPANRRVIEENARLLGIPIHIFGTDIFDSVFNVDKSPCYLCARMRRGYLYAFAKQLGCNKIALGHHFDDVI